METTNFTHLRAETIGGNAANFTHLQAGNAAVGSLKVGALALSKADSYALATEEKNNVFIGCTMSEASKALTLGLPAGQLVIVKNTGDTNAFTVKNASDDTGTSLAAGKSLLIVAGTAKDTSVVIALD
jgi:hypothetical protein